MVHGENRIPYWIDRRLTGLAGPEYHAIISFGLPIEPEYSQYGESRYISMADGVSIQDIIWDIPPIGAQAAERLGYATQKPVALLERIIASSSNPSDVVLDPFCGCATTMEAAQKLGREWIGIDIAIHAIKRVARVRLTERLGLVEGIDFTVEGVPPHGRRRKRPLATRQVPLPKVGSRAGRRVCHDQAFSRRRD